MNKIEIRKLDFPVDGYRYNVRVLTSTDGGKSWWYCGNGKYAKTWQDALDVRRSLKRSFNAPEEEPASYSEPVAVRSVPSAQRIQKQAVVLAVAVTVLVGIIFARWNAQKYDTVRWASTREPVQITEQIGG